MLHHRTPHGHHRHAVHPTGTAHAFLRFASILAFAAKDIQFVDKMYHEVGIDGIVPRVYTLRSGQSTADITLLLQDIIELNADGSGTIAEEGLCNLRVPEQFVGIHRSIGVTTARTHADICRNTESKVKVKVGIGTVREVPRIHIGIFLNRSTCMLVFQSADKADIKP